MENTYEKYDKNNISPIAAGITGLILGVVGTAAVALADKDTREKAKKKANKLKDEFKKWSQDTLHELHEETKSAKKDTAANLDQATKKADGATEDLKQKLDETIRPKMED